MDCAIAYQRTAAAAPIRVQPIHERGANADTCGQRCSILHRYFPRWLTAGLRTLRIDEVAFSKSCFFISVSEVELRMSALSLKHIRSLRQFSRLTEMR